MSPLRKVGVPIPFESRGPQLSQSLTDAVGQGSSGIDAAGWRLRFLQGPPLRPLPMGRCVFMGWELGSQR